MKRQIAYTIDAPGYSKQPALSLTELTDDDEVRRAIAIRRGVRAEQVTIIASIKTD